MSKRNKKNKTKVSVNVTARKCQIKSDKTFFKEVPEKLLPSVDDMLHHVQPGEPTANLGPTIEIVVFSYRDHDAAQITSADKVLTFLLH